MKRMTTIILLLVLNTTFFGQARLQAQCTNCRNSQSNHHLASSAVGINNLASGRASFAAGMEVEASGMESIGIGSMIAAEGIQSMIIGSGHGPDYTDRLTNSIPNSLMIGYNSIYPTMFISPAASRNVTGNVGIGNITSPEAKLHIRTDHGVGAGLFVEQENFRLINFWLGNKNHGISSVDDVGLVFHSGKNFLFEKGRVGINTMHPAYDLDVKGSIFSKGFTLYDRDVYKQSIEGWVLCSDANGQASWRDPRNFNDNDWTISGNNIYRMDGYVGIGTTQTYGYKLAVDGGIIAEEVTVKLSQEWPDYVFDEDYNLLEIQHLAKYIEQHKHLPGIPAAEQLRKSGLQLGKMESILLEKIEELTLYIIQQESRIKILENKINQ